MHRFDGLMPAKTRRFLSFIFFSINCRGCCNCGRCFCSEIRKNLLSFSESVSFNLPLLVYDSKSIPSPFLLTIVLAACRRSGLCFLRTAFSFRAPGRRASARTSSTLSVPQRPGIHLSLRFLLEPARFFPGSHLWRSASFLGDRIRGSSHFPFVRRPSSFSSLTRWPRQLRIAE